MMSRLDRRRFLAAAGSVALAGSASSIGKPAMAQTAFPSRPLRLIVPAPAGSRHGLSARLFAESLARELRQPVEVVNPENSPALSYAFMAKAKADGYTLGYATVELAILHWRGLSDLTPADFAPIALLNEDPAGIHVRSDSQWLSAKQLMDHIKSNPGKLKASSTPAGGIWHLSTVSWLRAVGLGVDALPWVPSTGPAAAVEEMMLGGADVVVCSTPEVRSTPQAKSVRTLAVMARNRIARFGDVPTLQQAIGTPHTAGAWRGLVAPKATDAATTAALTVAAKRAWDNKEFQDIMQFRGFLPAWSANQDFAQFLDAADANMGQTLRAAGVIKA